MSEGLTRIIEKKWGEECENFNKGEYSINVVIGEIGALMGTCCNPNPYHPKTYFGWCMQLLVNSHVQRCKKK